jgi:hypothetical protein
MALAGLALATPSTRVWIPSTDIQPQRTWHFGFDEYFNPGQTNDLSTDLSDVGLTYGPAPHLEVGVDFLTGVGSPIFLNAKYGFGPFGKQDQWAAAVGVYNVGFRESESPDILYGLVSYQTGKHRFHAGWWWGDPDVLVDPRDGSAENDGPLLGWDHSFGRRWWVAVDYQGGRSSFGATSVGVAYTASDQASFILGWDFYHSPAIADTATFQFDLNFGTP